jgi:hypothetical protein
MYAAKLFNAHSLDALQQAINEWLRMNKDILVHSSNLVVTNNSLSTGSEYNYQLLYTGPDSHDQELKEMAAAVTQEQSVEVKEINPEILKPSS